MECERIEPRLSAFADGELAEVEALGVRLHLADCSRCAGRLETLRAVSGAVRDLRPGRSDAGLEEVLRRTRAEASRSGSRPPRTSRHTKRWVGVAAALVLAALVAVWVAPGRFGDRAPVPREPTAPPRSAPPTPGLELVPMPTGDDPPSCFSPDECGVGAEPLWPPVTI